MSEDLGQRKTRPSRFGHDHKPKSLRYWLIPLAIAVAAIIFLPRLLALVE